MKQTVGVVLATYNGENFLDEQLQSIFNQTLLPDKVVIVDDCSTDGSMRIAEKWAQRHQETIEIHENIKNTGFIRNFERGISLCDTDFIALCDQDDIWHVDKLKKCISKLATDATIGLCYHNVDLVNVAGETIGADLKNLTNLDLPLERATAQDLIIKDARSPIPGLAIVFSSKLKSHFLPIPGEKTCPHDWWLCAISFFMFNPTYIAEPLAKYRIHENQASGPSSTLLKDTPYAIKKKITAKKILKNIKNEIKRAFNHHKKIKNRQINKENKKNDMINAAEKLKNLVNECTNISYEEKNIRINILEQYQ